MPGSKLRFLVVSGPTREPVDPVRYLSNYSTGTMGRFLVDHATKRGHAVEWVRCPEDAETARELTKALKGRIRRANVLFMAAAVCDVRPAAFSRRKIKKDRLVSLRLEKNPDVLAGLGRKKKPAQVFVGFALESENAVQNGLEKLRKKHLDFLLLQKVSAGKKPFGDVTLEAFLLDKSGVKRRFPAVAKKKLAGILIREAEALAAAKREQRA
ncbi:MAG: phosphopantothenoylcysteine decarboxylase [Candidatus Omnitrophica bacterium]|nr:phosphopantothenoylcysteine decarboxylase [Candidatus Omnitrophota bacterium]